MKKVISLCALVLLCFGLASCSGKNETAGSKLDLQKSIKNKKDSLMNNDKTLGNESAEDGVIIRSDAENLVEVRIENGNASVTLNAVRFDELYDYKKRYESEIYTGIIKIVGNFGKIKDACVAQIPNLDFLNGTDFVTPTIFLLMEDGTVEYVFVDFLPHEFQVQEFYSSGPILWIKNIKTLSSESDGEGFGSTTVFAEDKNGIRYDLRIPVSFSELYSGPWVCDIYNMDGYYSASGYYGVLNFHENGTVVFEKGWIGEDVNVRYAGTFDLTIAENSGIRPGMMTFDLFLDSSSHTKSEPKEIHSVYFAEAINLIGLQLWYSNGDYLHSNEKGPVMNWDFELGYNPLGDNPYISVGETTFGSYVEYLLFTIDSVRDMVESHGMVILDTGEYVEINGGYYRLLSLATNHQEHSSRETHYAVSDDGVIYEYNVILDEWTVIWVPD